MEFYFVPGTCNVHQDQNGVKKPSCTCMKYFDGEHCELRTKCNSTYCKNGGRCVENRKLTKDVMTLSAQRIFVLGTSSCIGYSLYLHVSGFASRLLVKNNT